MMRVFKNILFFILLYCIQCNYTVYSQEKYVKKNSQKDRFIEVDIRKKAGQYDTFHNTCVSTEPIFFFEKIIRNIYRKQPKNADSSIYDSTVYFKTTWDYIEKMQREKPFTVGNI